MNRTLFSLFFLITFLFCTESVFAACSSPTANAGAREWFTSVRKLKYCNGTNWVSMQLGGISAAATISGTALANFAGATTAVVSGTYAYIVGNQQLSIVDVSDRQAPVLVKTISNAGFGDYVAVYGNYVYINGASKIYPVDVTTKTNPVVGTNVINAAFASITAMKVQGSYLYLGATSRLSIVDLSTPATPSLAGSVLDSTRLSGSKSIAITGNYVVMSASTYNGITIIDVSTKTAPSITVGAYLNGMSGAASVVVSGDGNYAYVTCPGSNRLYVVDITNKAVPAAYQNVTSTLYFQGIRYLAIKDNRIFTGGSTSVNTNDNMVTLDITNPASFTVYSDNDQGYNMNPYSMSIDNNTMVALAGNIGTLFVYDLSPKPVLEFEQSFLNRSAPDKISDVVASGTLAVAMNTAEKLYVFDITTPSSFVLRGSVSMPAGASSFDSRAVAYDGYYAYVTEYNNNRVFIVDVGTDPYNPSIVATMAASASYAGILDAKVSGNYLYLAGPAGLSIIDVTTKTAPTAMSTVYPGGGNPERVRISGNYAYVLASSDILYVYDITNKAAPTVVGSLSHSNLSASNGFDVQGNYAYVGTTSRLNTIDISNPASPTMGTSLVSATAFAATSQFKASGTTGYFLGTKLVSINLTLPASPTFYGSVTTDSSTTYDGLDFNGSAVFTGTNTGFRSYSTASTPVLLKTSAADIGTVGGISTSGTYAFLTTNNSILSVNISGPTSPTIVSTLTDGTKLNAVKRNAVSGTRVFAVGTGYITAVDISTPTSTTISGYLSDGTNLPSAKMIKIVGNYAFVGSSNRLAVLDITGANPVHVTSLTNAKISGCADMSQSGNYIYLTCSTTNSFVVVDISNPVAPAVVGSLTSSDYLNGFDNSMVVTNNVVYIGFTNTNYTAITIDVSNPAAPNLLNNLYVSCNMFMNSTDANRIFCLNGGNKMYTLDVSDRYEDVLIKSISVTTGTYEEGVISGNLALSFVQNGMHVASIASSPTVARQSRLGGDKKLNDVRGLDIVGNYAYFATPRDYLLIYDISNVTSATLISSTYVGNNYQDYANAYNIVVSGTYAYVAGANESGAMIYDISNLAKPRRIGSLTSYNSNYQQQFIKVVGNYAYGTGTGSGFDGFAMYNVANPAASFWTDDITDSTNLLTAKGFDISGNYAFVCASGNSKITAVNLGTPTNLTVTSSLLDATKFAGCNGVTVSGTYAYMTGTTNGYFNVIDISNPASMVLTGYTSSTASFGGGAGSFEIAISGTTAVVTNSSYLTTIDISLPASPTIIDTYAISGTQGFVKIVGDKIFAANEGNDNVGVYNLTTPVKMGSCTTASQLEYDVANNTYKYCNGAFFYATTVPGLGGAGCSSPNGIAGTLDYYTPTNVLKYCDGTNWVQIGP
ncbi:hypothetical protein CIK05_04225 [Bdellovibrio sp. qaytius]|nr:hypothetical protein CIK05_04225 [Bdellovibrio sp. qaytius]